MDQFVLTFPVQNRFSDNELFEFCSANPDLHIERDSNGNLLIMSPSGGFSSNVHLKVYHQFANWVFANEALGYGFDASGGFRLPDKSMRSPDAAFVSKPRWDSLTDEQKRQFPPLCPDFVIEVRSTSDALPQLKLKMGEWIKNGCQLAWLVDPVEKQAYVFKPGFGTKHVDFEQRLDGEDVLPGFELDLKKLLPPG
ncbi:MAG: Uma2 family endonuclease [Cyclobacteriaceae bacterium]|jgi:Uma2 family endonuclease|nr:Uma2 family endonuclease [Flammeovirgaceae bacterium]